MFFLPSFLFLFYFCKETGLAYYTVCSPFITSDTSNTFIEVMNKITVLLQTALLFWFFFGESINVKKKKKFPKLLYRNGTIFHQCM